MPSKYHDKAMVRKNYHYEPIQIERLTKLAKKEGCSVASLLREGGDMLIKERINRIKLAKMNKVVDKHG